MSTSNQQSSSLQQRTNEAKLAGDKNIVAQQEKLLKSNEPAKESREHAPTTWQENRDFSNIEGIDKQKEMREISSRTSNDPIIQKNQFQQQDTQKEQQEQKKGGTQGGQMMSDLNAGQRKLQQQILDQKKDAVYWEQKHKELINLPQEQKHQDNMLKKQQEEIERLQRLREQEQNRVPVNEYQVELDKASSSQEADKKASQLPDVQQQFSGQFQQRFGAGQGFGSGQQNIPYFGQVEQREAVTSAGVLDQGAKHYLDRPVQDALQRQQWDQQMQQESQQNREGLSQQQQYDKKDLDKVKDQQHRQQIGQDFVQGVPRENLSQDELQKLKNFNPVSQTGQKEAWQTEGGTFQHKKDLSKDEKGTSFWKFKEQQEQQERQKQEQQQQQQQQEFQQQNRELESQSQFNQQQQFSGDQSRFQQQQQQQQPMKQEERGSGEYIKDKAKAENLGGKDVGAQFQTAKDKEFMSQKEKNFGQDWKQKQFQGQDLQQQEQFKKDQQMKEGQQYSSSGASGQQKNLQQ